jgi:hypothetical protein
MAEQDHSEDLRKMPQSVLDVQTRDVTTGKEAAWKGCANTMSHAIGAVRFVGDGAVMFFEYDGTSNTCIPALWPSQDAVNQHWRSDDEAIYSKTCGCEPVAHWEPVEIMSTYADGKHWPGLACRSCMVLTTSGMTGLKTGT